jgi:hypothetical protein
VYIYAKGLFTFKFFLLLFSPVHDVCFCLLHDFSYIGQSLTNSFHVFCYLCFRVPRVRHHHRQRSTLSHYLRARSGTYRGALFFLSGSVSRGVSLETLSPFIFSSGICSRDMPRGQQLQIPLKEVIAKSPFTNRWSRPRSSLDVLKSLLLSRRSFEPPPDVLLDQLPLFAHSSPGRSILTLTPSVPLYALFLLGMRRQSDLLSQSRNLTRQSSTPSTSFRSKAQVCDHA